MRFREAAISGAFLIEIEPHADERGFFARTVCEEEIAAQGLVARYPQSSISFNHARGTVRGMHFSRAPHEETKIVRCTAGVIYDVLIDLRPASPTYLAQAQAILSADNWHAFYVPRGVAHGFQVLADRSEVLYMIDTPYVAGAAAGIRWDDPACRVEWPAPVTTIHARDLTFPDWAG